VTNFAIMRSKKISKLGSVASSLSHAYRERETENADPALLEKNELLTSKSVNEAMGKMRELLPEKRRSDAVTCVEYLFTTSPEWMKKATPAEQADYFDKSKKWLYDKYGEQNVVATVIHRDEKTPHMSAFVVPMTADGRLSAKEHIGSREKMKADLTAHAKTVEHLGLVRGIEGSRAKHVSLKTFYAALEKPLEPLEVAPEDMEPQVTEKRALMPDKLETPEEVAMRVNKALKSASEPLIARLKTLQLAQDKAKAEISAATSLRAKLGSFYKQVLEGLKLDQQQALVKTVGEMRAENAKTAEKDRIEAERQRRVDSLPNLVKTKAGAVLVFAQNALEAIKAKAGNWRSVDWATLEKRTAQEAIHKHHQAPADVADAVLRHSPNHADKTEAQIKALVDNVRLKSAPEKGLSRENDNDLSR